MAGDHLDFDDPILDQQAEDVAICPVCGDRSPGRARFCMMCGARLSVDEGERRTVSVVFADLSGFTSYSETVDPEQVRALADETASRLGEIVRRYGGTVDKIIGDCVMAIFGAPTAHEDDPERAVRSSLDMMTYVTEHADDFAGLTLSVGVHTGEAIYAPVGPSGEYTVLGDTVNTAARLQGAAGKGEVIIGEATYRAVADSIDAEELPPVVAKNKRNPVIAFRAVGVKGERKRRAARAPLIGRHLEIDRLSELWERVRTERAQYLMTVTGTPGVGKSRLLETFIEKLGTGARIHAGHCPAYGEGITYWPVVEMIKDAAGILHDDAREVVSKKLGMLLESVGVDDLDQLRTIAVAVAHMVGAPTTPRGTYSATEISQGELHWGLRRLFELLAAKQPLVLHFEDLHRAEPTLLGLIGSFLDSKERAPILVLASGRPELAENDPAFVAPGPTRRAIRLEPLDEDDARAMLAALLGTDALGEQLETLLRAADGNPLYLEEIVRMLTASGLIDAEGRPTGVSLDSFPVPDSLQALIDARLDRLGTPEKRVAGRAAVIGATFWTGAVEHLDGDGMAVEPGLRALEERDVVSPAPTSTIAGEREYGFRHVMIRDVAYARIPKAERARLHERCGDWLSALPGAEDDLVEFTAFHLEQACRLAADVGKSAGAPPILPAVRALARAGEKADSREGTRDAERFYSRALELLGDRMPETAMELRYRRSKSLAVLGDLDQALRSMQEVADRAGELSRDDLQGQVLREMANIELAIGRASDARAHLDQADAIGERLRDKRLRVQVAFTRSSLRAYFDGANDAATEELTWALDAAAELDDRHLQVEGHLRLGSHLSNIGALEASELHCLRAAELAGEQGSLRDEARATHSLAFVKFYRGPLDEAEELEQRAVGWLERTADGYTLVQAMRQLAKIAVARCDFATAELRLRDTLPLAEQGGGWLGVEINRYLAETAARQGHAVRARRMAAAARALMPDEDMYARAATRIAEGLAETCELNPDAACAAFDEALGLLDQQGLVMDLGEARITYAWALRRFGEDQAADEQLDAARAVFDPMGARATLEQIERERSR